MLETCIKLGSISGERSRSNISDRSLAKATLHLICFDTLHNYFTQMLKKRQKCEVKHKRDLRPELLTLYFHRCCPICGVPSISVSLLEEKLYQLESYPAQKKLAVAVQAKHHCFALHVFLQCSRLH